MAKKDSRVDAHIAKSADFAKPILRHIRRLVHAACPDVVETIKWGCPYFDYKGTLCGMASFKQHCALIFWNGPMIFREERSEGMGQFGRITSVSDLPDEKTLSGYFKEAVRLNEEGVKRPPRAKKEEKELTVPGDLKAALGKSKKAMATFAGFSYSHQKEYIEWLTEAKRTGTRQKRLATAIDWMANGKSRHWKYR